MTTLETESTVESSDMLSLGKELGALKKEVSETGKEKQSDSQKSVEKKLIPMKDVVDQFYSHLSKISSTAEPYHVRLDKKTDVYLKVTDTIFSGHDVKVIDIIKDKDRTNEYSTKKSRVWLFYDESTKSFYMSFDEGLLTKYRRWERIDATHARKYLNKIWERMMQAEEQKNRQWNEEVDKYASANVDSDSIEWESLA